MFKDILRDINCNDNTIYVDCLSEITFQQYFWLQQIILTLVNKHRTEICGTCLSACTIHCHVAGVFPQYANPDPCDLRGPTGGGGVLVGVYPE